MQTQTKTQKARKRAIQGRGASFAAAVAQSPTGGKTTQQRAEISSAEQEQLNERMREDMARKLFGGFNDLYKQMGRATFFFYLHGPNILAGMAAHIMGNATASARLRRFPDTKKGTRAADKLKELWEAELEETYEPDSAEEIRQHTRHMIDITAADMKLNYHAIANAIKGDTKYDPDRECMNSWAHLARHIAATAVWLAQQGDKKLREVCKAPNLAARQIDTARAVLIVCPMFDGGTIPTAAKQHLATAISIMLKKLRESMRSVYGTEDTETDTTNPQ